MRDYYENLYWKQRDIDAETIRLYQQTFSYLLAQPWYVERLPEIRKHVTEHVISKQN